MTAEEKTCLMDFLDLAGDFLKDGHRKTRAAYGFSDDEAESGGTETALFAAEERALPLAYTVEEAPGFMYQAEDGEEADASGEGVFDKSVSGETAASLKETAAGIALCRACGLGSARTNAVPGEGAVRPLVMVIGEGPGADEDATGRPFVGRAGQLLDKMLASIGLFRDTNCYIANMVKCRPPGNRDPAPEEIAACSPFLKRQIELLRPRAILCVGRVAAQNLLKTSRGINSLRGEFAEYRSGGAGGEIIPVLCTFHPSALLRDESLKRPAWEDLKLLKSRLDSRDISAPSGET